MQVGIIGGGGTVGSTLAFCLGWSGLADRVVLVDARENIAKSHAMDIEQAVCEQKPLTIDVGDYALLAGCDVVVISAGAPERPVASRNEYLAANLAIVRPIIPKLMEHCPESVFIVATNPVDVMTYVVCHESGLHRSKVLGFSRNDTLRFRWAVARVLGVDPRSVDCLVLGEHGDNQVPLYSRVMVDGVRVQLTKSQCEDIDLLVRNWFAQYQQLKSGRSSGWTSGSGLFSLVRTMVEESGEIVPCSVTLGGEYGLTDVSVCVPVRLCRTGVKEVVELPLAEEEAVGLRSAASKVKNLAVHSAGALTGAGPDVAADHWATQQRGDRGRGELI